MKKWISLIIAIVMVCTASACFALEAGVVMEGEEPIDAVSFETAGHLWTYWQTQNTNWEESAYPDYIAGVWSTDGGMENLTFGITDDEKGEAGRQEILELVENDSTVSFEKMKYSHAELFAIQQKLVERMGDETGAMGMGVYEMENHLHIDIDMENPNAEAFMKECFKEYGDRIVFEDSKGVLLEETAMKRSFSAWIWVLLAAVVLISGCAVILLGRRSVRVLQRADGGTETSRGMSVKEAVRQAEELPSDVVYERIKENIEK